MSFDNEQGVRINKYLADSGKCSRRQADKLIEDGLVTIDGKVAQLGDRVLPGMQVSVQGEKLSTNIKRKYIMLNKPVGIVCTADPNEPDNVVSFIDHDDRIYPIGRLDKDSEGLLLLTNDGDIVNKILRASEKHEKEYEVLVDKPVNYDFVKKMEGGVKILGTTTLPCKVVKTGDRSFSITLTQGLNRQIRRMCEALGYRVTSLRRERIMNIQLGRLKSGHWRNLTGPELAELMARLEDD
ncbi:MAG: pseudouridine synthase [Clostridia bacterium]|nr:pseudouridine synthase [Clostridia bacterium]